MPANERSLFIKTLLPSIKIEKLNVGNLFWVKETNKSSRYINELDPDTDPFFIGQIQDLDPFFTRLIQAFFTGRIQDPDTFFTKQIQDPDHYFTGQIQDLKPDTFFVEQIQDPDPFFTE